MNNVGILGIPSCYAHCNKKMNMSIAESLNLCAVYAHTFKRCFSSADTLTMQRNNDIMQYNYHITILSFWACTKFYILTFVLPSVWLTAAYHHTVHSIFKPF